MVAFKNFLGGLMYVDESRVDEYLSKGYERIAEEGAHTKSEEIIEDVKVSEEVTEEKPKRRKKR